MSENSNIQGVPMHKAIAMFIYIGVVWPLEGLPSGIKWISNIMPIKFAVIAVKAVVSKGTVFMLRNLLYIVMSLFTRYGFG